MRKTLRNIFIPTEENGFVPSVLSLKTFLPLVVLAVAFLVSPTIYNYRQIALLAGSGGYSANEIIALVNVDRARVGLSELKINATLGKAAETKVQDMLNKNYFSHVSPDNKTPWDFIKNVGYKYLAAGENLAIDFPTAEGVNEGLMNSPTHRANILNKLYTEIGVSVGYGIFEGRETILVAQYFGKPYATQPIKPATTPTKPATQPATPAETAKTNAPTKLAEEILDVKPEVLGESKMKLSIPKIPDEVLQSVAVFVNKEILMRLFSAFAVLVTVIAVFFMMIRGIKMGTSTILRTLILVLAFGYVLFNGSGSVIAAKVSPISFSTISIEQGK